MKKKPKIKWRNWLAVRAWFRKSGAVFVNKKKKENKEKCRKKIKEDE